MYIYSHIILYANAMIVVSFSMINFNILFREILMFLSQTLNLKAFFSQCYIGIGGTFYSLFCTVSGTAGPVVNQTFPYKKR